MLSQEQMSTIAAMIGTDADVFAKAISDEKEQTIELPEGRFLTKKDEATLLDNHGKKKYDEGKSKGSRDHKELIKTTYNLEGETVEDLFNNFKKKTLSESKIEPNKKLEEAANSIAALQKTVADKETEITKLKDDYSKQALEHKILGLIPANNVGLQNKTVLTDMRSNGYNVLEVDGVLSVTKNGETLKDNLQNPIKFDEFSKQYLSEKQWLKVDKKGRGGEDDDGEKALNYDQFVKQCEKDGINPAGAEAQAKAKELAKGNPDFYN